MLVEIWVVEGRYGPDDEFVPGNEGRVTGSDCKDDIKKVVKGLNKEARLAGEEAGTTEHLRELRAVRYVRMEED